MPNEWTCTVCERRYASDDMLAEMSQPGAGHCLQCENSKLKQELEDLRGEVSDGKTAITRIESSLDHSKQECEFFRSEVEKARRRASEMDSRNRDLLSRLEQRTPLYVQSPNSSGGMDELMSELSELRRRVPELEMALSEMKSSTCPVSDLQRATDEIEKLRVQRSEAESESRRQLSVLESDLKQARARLSAREVGKEADGGMAATLQSAVNELARVSEELKASEGSVADADEAKTEVRRLTEILNTMLDLADGEVIRLRTEWLIAAVQGRSLDGLWEDDPVAAPYWRMRAAEAELEHRKGASAAVEWSCSLCGASKLPGPDLVGEACWLTGCAECRMDTPHSTRRKV